MSRRLRQKRGVARFAQRPANDLAAWLYFTNASMRGWGVYGGASVATPIVAAIYAMSPSRGGTGASALYSAPQSAFNDIPLGTKGLCLTYRCTALAGYDGPTGRGTPNGVAAF